MMNSFFHAWQLWQKMTFALGCALVSTVALGCLKLFYNRWRLRHFSFKSIRVTQSIRGATAGIPETVAVMSTIQNTVPFGIRAIENGVKVEGIWISPPATPQSSRGSSPVSSQDSRARFSPRISQFSILRDNNDRLSDDSSDPLDGFDPSLSLHVQKTNVRLTGKHSSAQNVLNIDPIMTSRRKYENRGEYPRGGPPTQNTLIQSKGIAAPIAIHASKAHILPPIDSAGSLNLPHSSSSDLRTREERSAIVRQNVFAFRAPHMERSDSNTSIAATVRISDTPSGAIVTCTQQLLIKVHTPDDDGDLGLYDKHRLSQVASMGQLVPRHRPLLESYGSTDSIQSDDYFQARTTDEILGKHNQTISSNGLRADESESDNPNIMDDVTVQDVQERIGGEFKRFYENGYQTELRAEDVQPKPHRIFDWSVGILRRSMIKTAAQKASEEINLDDLESQNPRPKQRKLRKKGMRRETLQDPE